MNEICELASSGLNQGATAFALVVLVVFATILLILRKKYSLKSQWLLLVLLLLFALSTPIRAVMAAENCITQTVQGGSNNAVTPQGTLIDDNPSMSEDGDFPGEFFANFSILDNDNAPEGDPFNISTLRLIGDSPYPGFWEGSNYDIVNPNDGNNPYGYWYITLDCPDGSDTTSVSECPPTNNINVRLYDSAPAGTPISIQYTVQTQSGVQLDPATITVIKPEPSTISVSDITINVADCADIANQFPINFMNYVSTTGPSIANPNTIDLEANTPGQQTTVTINGFVNLSFSVNSNGVLNYIAGAQDYTFVTTYTIDNYLGTTSNTGTFTITADFCEMNA